MLKTRKEILDYALSFPDVYFDIPFHDPNWQVVRHKGNNKVFVWTFERAGHIWINLKCNPDDAYFLRNSNSSILPAYHMNKLHWNSIVLDGRVDDEMVMRLVVISYELTA